MGRPVLPVVGVAGRKCVRQGLSGRTLINGYPVLRGYASSALDQPLSFEVIATDCAETVAVIRC